MEFTAYCVLYAALIAFFAAISVGLFFVGFNMKFFGGHWLPPSSTFSQAQTSKVLICTEATDGISNDSSIMDAAGKQRSIVNEPRQVVSKLRRRLGQRVWTLG